MRYQGRNPKENLEQALAELRGDEPGAEAAQAAGDRVWQRLGHEAVGAAPELESIRGCGDIRRLLVQYRAGQLAAERAMVVEAHLHECVACRRELERGQVSGSPAASAWQHELPRARGGFRWAVAAAATVALGVSIYFIQTVLLSGPSGMRARVESLSGGLYKIGFNGEQALKIGDELSEGERVRTAGGSRAALRLRDGSVVEMNERASFAVSLGRKDTTIKLDRGNIIVQAAKRSSGHLYVAAPDCRVSVTGTVFAVNSGMKGSRVSVIEGEVRVAEAGTTSVLHPGDQLSTNPSVGAVPVKQEIAWSQDLDKHLALLAAFQHLSNKLEAVQMPGLRYQSKLLPTLPADTILYAGIPNLGDAAQQANQLFQQELQESPVLNEWWQQQQSRKGAPDFGHIIDEIHSLGQYLGDEIVVSVGLENHKGAPLVVAQVQKQGLKEFIEQEAASHSSNKEPRLHVLSEQELMQMSPQQHSGLLIVVRPDFVAASFDVLTLQHFDAALNQGGGGFASTPFGQRMAGAYQQGADILLGANLQAMAAEHAAMHVREKGSAFAKTGLADVQYLVVERKNTGGQLPLNHVELTFTGPRRGMASWLAAPAPIGGLDFISKDAGAVASFVSKSPAQMLDDVLGIAYSSNAKARGEVSQAESELNINFHKDLAETLGGEITFALDGPILPTPSWKVIAEVYNPGRLQSTIQQLVNDANQQGGNKDVHISLEQSSANGLTFYTVHLQHGAEAVEVDYTFTGGYMIIAPSRALVMNAITVQQSGNSLAKSSDFRALLPQDQHANVSAVLYQNLAPLVGPVMKQLTPAQLQSLQQLAAESKPSVVCAYGEDNAIRIASNTRFFGLDLNTMALSTLMKLAHPPGTFEPRKP